MTKTLVEQFRCAVSSGEFHRASELWNDYTAERLVEARRGCGDRLPEMRELMEWTRIVVACSRAQSLRNLRTRLTEAHAASAYGRAVR
ncbi:MAG: hypothetical protein WBY44_04550 [Bryobacteraceae bacterium]